MRLLLSILLLSVACHSTAQAHSAHSQVTEVEWNSVSCRFEIAMKLDAVALEDSVSVLQGTRFRLESSQATDAIIQAWMKQSFRIEIGNSSHAGTIRWVGHELKLHTVWLYFEYRPAMTNQPDSPSSPPKQSVMSTDIRIENRCLLDVRPETIHFIQLRHDQSIVQGHCSHQQPIADFSKSQHVSTTRSISLRRPGLNRAK